MSCAVERANFPPWIKQGAEMSEAVAMAIGQIEEGLGLIDRRWVGPGGYVGPDHILDAYKAFVNARNLLSGALAAQRVASPARNHEVA